MQPCLDFKLSDAYWIQYLPSSEPETDDHPTCPYRLTALPIDQPLHEYDLVILIINLCREHTLRYCEEVKSSSLPVRVILLRVSMEGMIDNAKLKSRAGKIAKQRGWTCFDVSLGSLNTFAEVERYLAGASDEIAWEMVIAEVRCFPSIADSR